MRASFDRWWLVPFVVLVASTLVALSVIVFGPSFFDRSSSEVAQRAASETAPADCPGASATEYACYQQRYRNLVLDSGVEAAFAQLKDEYEKNDFVKSNCHQLTHEIGYAAAERYGNVPDTFSRGDDFCAQGYYHGAMISVAAKIGPDKILEEADTLCADLREHQKYSIYHLSCVHGLGHGFMVVLGNELFESLHACDALTDGRERGNCYSGVFMENIMTEDHSGHPSKYLKAERPLYPCTDVEPRYQKECYLEQASYALRTQDSDFARVFDLCAALAEEDFRSACYRGLGVDAAGQSIEQHITDEARSTSTKTRCMLGEDHEARSNCVIGAVRIFTLYYREDTRAKELCESLGVGLCPACLKASEEFYEELFD